MPCLLLGALRVLAACGDSTAGDAPATDGGTDADATPPPRRPHPPEDDDAATPAPDTWCSHQGTHAFCADFDEADVGEGWDWFSGFGDVGTYFHDVPSDRSPPRGVAMTLPAWDFDGGGASVQGGAFIKDFVHASPKTLRAALDVKIDAFDPPADYDAPYGAVTLAFARSTPGGGKAFPVSAALDVRRTKTELAFYAATDADASTFPNDATTEVTALARARWVHVEIAIALAAGGGTATVTYDGAVAGTVTIPSFDATGLDGAEVTIGEESNSGPHAKDYVVTYDDVLVDLE